MCVFYVLGGPMIFSSQALGDQLLFHAVYVRIFHGIQSNKLLPA